MCSIFGLVRRPSVSREDRWLVRRMADAMKHRGPDGEGFRVTDRAVIGMTRLAIIDHAGGWQPLESEDASVTLVANGEIYNYVELKEQFASQGVRFRTNSDCEAIIGSYQLEGISGVRHLRGMFAFALLDHRRQRLFLVRDRLGEKPLSVVLRPDGLTFCSELRGLVGSGAIPFELCPDALRIYYHWGFIPEDHCAVRGVMKLPPGSFLEYDLTSGEYSIQRYWRLEDSPPVPGDPCTAVRAELDAVSKITMRSDVPIGIGLSGGIDSSAIAVMASRHATQPVSALTIGYEGVAWQDERSAASGLASRLRIPHLTARLSTAEVVEDFPALCLARDEPLVDMSGWGFQRLMRLASENGIRVVHIGQGGDELFWGYAWHRRALFETERKGRLLGGCAGMLDYLRPRLPPLSLAGCASWLEGIFGFREGLLAWRRDRQSPGTQVVFWDIRDEYRDAVALLSRVSGPVLKASRQNPAWCFDSVALWEDLPTGLTALLVRTFLQSNGLILGDRLSMAQSVEARAPLVDYRLAEVVVGLQKQHGSAALGNKELLRRALAQDLPAEVLKRRKRGFTPPWRRWVRGLHARYANDLIDGVLASRGILDRGEATRFRRPTTVLGRPNPLAMPSLVLEQWARGMQSISPSRPRDPGMEPRLEMRRSG